LGPDIDDKALFKAFSVFGSCSDARVMWDQNTQRSRGYGFVAFRYREDAERALSEMNGEWLGNRAIRCNWANQKVTSTSNDTNNNDFESVLASSSSCNTTVYIGNLTPDVTETLLHSFFDDYGEIDEVRMQKEKGYAFIKYKSHDDAARAIAAVHGRFIGARAVKCAWGKERTNTGTVVTPTASSIPVYPIRPPVSGGVAPGPVVGQVGAGSASGSSPVTPVPPYGTSPYAPYPMVAYDMYNNPQVYNSQQYYPHMTPQANPAVPPNGMYGQTISYQYPQPYFPYDFPGQGLSNFSP